MVDVAGFSVPAPNDALDPNLEGEVVYGGNIIVEEETTSNNMHQDYFSTYKYRYENGDSDDEKVDMDSG
jgi:hypothetical protein